MSQTNENSKREYGLGFKILAFVTVFSFFSMLFLLLLPSFKSDIGQDYDNVKDLIQPVTLIKIHIPDYIDDPEPKLEDETKSLRNRIYLKYLDSAIAENYSIKFVEDETEADVTFEFKVSGNLADIDEVDSLLSGALVPVTNYYSIPNKVSDYQNHYIELTPQLEPLRNQLEVNYEFSSRLNDKYIESGNSMRWVTFSQLDAQKQLLYFNNSYYLEEFNTGAIFFSLSMAGDLDDIRTLEVAEIDTVITQLYGDANQPLPTADEVLSLRMTGVTAIARKVTDVINRQGDPTYISERIVPFLQEADITHTSNEVSFLDNCVSGNLRFCSKPEHYKAITEASGFDIVELTGNHNKDFGAKSFLDTLEYFEENNIEYFGGGVNRFDASSPLIIEEEGNSIGFLGYNYFNTYVSTGTLAGENRPGANGYDPETMKTDIDELSRNVDQVVVTFQYQECYSYPESDVIYPPCYKAEGAQDQTRIFKSAIDAGADIVIGTQAHQPQTYETYQDGLIFYGLGNLYFDQDRWIGTRQGLIPTHYIYNGQHLQTRIDTTLYDRELQPYLTTGEDRDLLLKLLKEAREQ